MSGAGAWCFLRERSEGSRDPAHGCPPAIPEWRCHGMEFCEGLSLQGSPSVHTVWERCFCWPLS